MEEEGYYEEEDEDEFVDGVPQPKEKDDLFSLFGKIWKTPDSSKVSNLSGQELGRLPMSVRDNQHLKLLGETLGHKNFAKFFGQRAEITFATACSKNGWIPGLFVTQKKFTSKSSSRTMSLPEKKSKWNPYGKNKQQQIPQA